MEDPLFWCFIIGLLRGELVTCRSAMIEEARDMPVAVASLDIVSDGSATREVDEVKIVDVVSTLGKLVEIEIGQKLHASRTSFQYRST